MRKRWWLWLIFFGLVFSGGKGAIAGELLIDSFETEKDIAKWENSDNVILEKSTEQVTNGKYSLKATFLNKGGTYSALTLKYPNYPSKDFSKYEYLTMDVYYPKRAPGMNDCMAIVNFIDSKGNVRPGWVPLVAYEGKRSHPKIALFLGIGQLSDKVEFDFSDVAHFSIVMNRPAEDFTCYIDNMRLITKPPVDDEKPQVKPVVSVGLEKLARFRSLNILYLGKTESDKRDLAKKFHTAKVLMNNQVNFDVGVPSSLKQLKQYDLVVFDDFSVRELTSSQMDCIKQFYGQGGAVVMLGGRNSFAGTKVCPGYQNTPIENILPVKLVKPGMYKVVNYQLKLNVKKPLHPVMEKLPWMKVFVFAISDADIEDVDGYTRNIEAKENTEVLAAELGSEIPLIVSGERSLIFNLEPRLVNFYFPYDFWEKFIIQAFNYVTKDKVKDRVVLAKVETLSSLPLDSKIIEGSIYAVNLSDNPKTVKGQIHCLSSIKKVELDIKGKELKKIEFSIPASGLEVGSYPVCAEIEEPDKDSLSGELLVESAFSLSNRLPVAVFCRNEPEDMEIRIENAGKKDEKVRLELWLEKGKGRIKNLLKEEVRAKAGKDKVVGYGFKPDAAEGRYQLCSYLYRGERLLASATSEIRIIKKTVPFLERSIDLRVRGDAFAEKGILPLDRLLALEDETGLRRSDEFTMEMAGAHMVHIAGEGMNGQFPGSWEDYIAALHKLHDTKIPFTIAPFNFWGNREKYESVVENLGRMIKLACEIGKEYFVGVRMSESGAMISYVIFGEKQTNLEKVDAFVNFISGLVKDLGLPEDKLLFLDISVALPEEWRLACGKNVVVGQAFGPIVPIELSQSALRGMSKSFSQWWEWEITRWPFGYPGQTVQAYFDAKTGRPTDTLQDIPNYFYGLPWAGHEGFSENIYKMYLVSYYNGADGINAYSETLYNENQKEAIQKFMEFIRANPRGEEIVSPVAIVKSKGSMWMIPWFPGAGGPLNRKDVLKEKDFLYLKTFFPEFSDDAINTKAWWTGTPYGTVDLVYPVMKLEDMKKYNAMVFLSYNRMDSVRKDFLDDVMTYVEEGGIVVLSVDQLRTVKGKIGQDKLMPFLGARIEDKYPLPPKKKIKEYIEIKDQTPFKLKKGKYPVSGQMVRMYGATAKQAKEVAVDAAGSPVLLMNKYGKGYVFLFAVSELSAIPPEGESPFVRDVLDKVCAFRDLPVDISPRRDDIKFLISKTEDKEAAVFVVNHGEKTWSGDVIVDLKAAGLSEKITDEISTRIGIGYEVKEIKPRVKKQGDKIIISGITLCGDTEDFTSYRQASFVYLRLEGK